MNLAPVSMYFLFTDSSKFFRRPARPPHIRNRDSECRAYGESIPCKRSALSFSMPVHHFPSMRRISFHSCLAFASSELDRRCARSDLTGEDCERRIRRDRISPTHVWMRSEDVRPKFFIVLPIARPPKTLPISALDPPSSETGRTW